MQAPTRLTRIESAKHDAILAAMKAVPAASHMFYPQYEGYWDDWVLVVLHRNVEVKGGRALEFWQVSIGKRMPADDLGPESWTVYSPQRDSNIGRIPLVDVTEVVAL